MAGSDPSKKEPDWFSQDLVPHEPKLRSYLRHRYPSVDPDDVIQESYLKLLKLRSLGGIRSLKSYFFALASHTAIEVFRKGRRHPPPITVSELPEAILMDTAPETAELLQDRERLELVASALETLPGRCHEIATLAIVHGMNSAQIALQLNLAESTVRVQLARAIEKCSAYVRAHSDRP